MSILKQRYLKQLPFVLLVSLNLVFIIAFTGNQLNLSKLPSAGWRRVNIELIQTKLQSGELSRKEAQWYRFIPTAADEAPDNE